LIPKQFKPQKPLVKTPATPKVKNGGFKTPAVKPIPTLEERVLMLAKARKLDAESRVLNFKRWC
jgi:hypothetical protein